MPTATEQIEQMKLELAAKVEKRRLATGLEREGAKWGFNPQWRTASQWEFVFTYTSEAQAQELARVWAKVNGELKGTVENQGSMKASKTLNLSGGGKTAASKSAVKRTVCESELRRGGSTSVKRFAARVADLNGHSEDHAIGQRVNGSVPGANAVLNLKF